MTDLEKVKRCAERMGYTVTATAEAGVWKCVKEREMLFIGHPFGLGRYNPLTNKAQAFELVERLHLEMLWNEMDDEKWYVVPQCGTAKGWDADLCRAIVECASQIPDEGAST